MACLAYWAATAYTAGAVIIITHAIQIASILENIQDCQCKITLHIINAKRNVLLWHEEDVCTELISNYLIRHCITEHVSRLAGGPVARWWSIKHLLPDLKKNNKMSTHEKENAIYKIVHKYIFKMRRDGRDKESIIVFHISTRRKQTLDTSPEIHGHCFEKFSMWAKRRPIYILDEKNRSFIKLNISFFNCL